MSVEEEEEEEEDTLTTQNVKIKAKNAGFYLHAAPINVLAFSRKYHRRGANASV